MVIGSCPSHALRHTTTADSALALGSITRHLMVEIIHQRMLLYRPLPRQIPFTYSLNDVAHGYGELSPCHSLCAGYAPRYRWRPTLFLHLQRREFAPHFEMPGGRFATVVLNCTIGISASGYILISTPQNRGQSPRLLYPASPGSALTANQTLCQRRRTRSRIMRIVQPCGKPPKS